MKIFRATCLNCRRNKRALTELSLIRSRDDVLLTTETPITEGIPVEIPQYTAIHAENDARTCIYVKDKSIKYINRHEATRDEVSIDLIGNRKLTVMYQPKGTKLTKETSRPMTIGEVRMGDYNSPESSTRYRRLQQWILDQSATERSPDEATHVKGNKLDHIITKDDPENDVITKIYHNGAVENSGHKCQSISIPLPILPTPINTKTDYRKLDIEDMLERIGKLPEPKNADELINQLESIRQTLKTVRSGNKTRLPLKVLDA